MRSSGWGVLVLSIPFLAVLIVFLAANKLLSHYCWFLPFDQRMELLPELGLVLLVPLSVLVFTFALVAAVVLHLLKRQSSSA